MDSMDINGMLVQLCGTIRVGAMRSTVEPSLAGMCRFAKGKFGKIIVVGY